MESTNAEDVANGIVSKNNTQTSQIQELQKEVSKLRKTIVEQDQKIEMLTKNQKNMNDRLRAQERYSRKDSVLIVNPPFDSRSVQDVAVETLKFFDKFLGVYLERPNIKACHIVPGQLKYNNMPTVICNFIYFADQKEIFKKIRALRNKKNAINGNNIYINEPLPECEAQIKAEATKRNLITTTHNCVVSVLVENNEQKPQFVRVNEIGELDKLTTIKKRNVKNDDVDIRSSAAKRQK